MPDITLDRLIKTGQISVRSSNLCSATELNSLSRIINFYERFGSFSMIRNCGVRSNNELISLCENHLAVNTLGNTQDGLPERINDNPFDLTLVANNSGILSEYRKIMLQKHFLYLITKISKRSMNGLKIAFENLQSIDSLVTILSDSFSFKSLKNIGTKSSEELEQLRIELHKTLDILNTLPEEILQEYYSKIILKSIFPDLPSNLFTENIDFYEKGKIKIFKLLKHLIESRQMFNTIQREAFRFDYTYDYIENQNTKLIASSLNITNERFRQVRIGISKKIRSKFQYLEKIKIDNIIDYKIDFDESIIHINNNLCKLINETEGTNFNKQFISLVFGYFIGHLFTRFGFQTFYIDPKTKRNGITFKSHYFIHVEDFSSFKYEMFINDFSRRIEIKRTKTELINLRIYVLKFIVENKDPVLEHLIKAIKLILSIEFDIKFTNDDEIIVEPNKKKYTYEYYYSIIEDRGNPMKLSEITKIANRLFPFLNSTDSKVRSILGGEKTKFIYFGRSSTYGLRVWEQNGTGIMGGTIRDLVESYLLSQIGPENINDILDYVSNYRKTTSVNILTNLKLDESNKFIFYKNEFVGLSIRHNESLNFRLIKSRSTWEERFIKVINFRILNPNRWPNAVSEDIDERSGYTLLYMSRRKYKVGKLTIEKEELLKSIGFDLDK